MKKNYCLIIVFFILLFACKTTGDVVEVSTTTVVDATDDVFVTTTTVASEPTITTTTTSTTTTTLQPLDERLQFSFDEKLSYSALERKIRNLFLTIEDKISEKDFDGWYSSLSESYRSLLNDNKYLDRISKKSQYLINKNVVLKTPKDYFENVVIIAREGQKLEYRGYKKLSNQSLIVYNGITGYDINYQYKFIYENDGWHLDK